MDFHSMKRKELQALCKKHKIPANLKNSEMANRLTSLLKGEDKILGENGREIESDVENKRVKKVRFSPETQTFEFQKSEVKYVTRSRGRRLVEKAAAARKKEGKGGIKNEASGSILPSDVANKDRVMTRKSLRRREVVDKNEDMERGLKKKGRERNLRQGKDKARDNVAEGGERDVEFMEIGVEKVFRRSKRNVTMVEDYKLMSRGTVAAESSLKPVNRAATEAVKEKETFPVVLGLRRSTRNVSSYNEPLITLDDLVADVNYERKRKRQRRDPVEEHATVLVDSISIELPLAPLSLNVNSSERAVRESVVGKFAQKSERESKKQTVEIEDSLCKDLTSEEQPDVDVQPSLAEVTEAAIARDSENKSLMDNLKKQKRTSGSSFGRKSPPKAQDSSKVVNMKITASESTELDNIEPGVGTSHCRTNEIDQSGSTDSKGIQVWVELSIDMETMSRSASLDHLVEEERISSIKSQEYIKQQGLESISGDDLEGDENATLNELCERDRSTSSITDNTSEVNPVNAKDALPNYNGDCSGTFNLGRALLDHQDLSQTMQTNNVEIDDMPGDKYIDQVEQICTKSGKSDKSSKENYDTTVTRMLGDENDNGGENPEQPACLEMNHLGVFSTDDNVTETSCSQIEYGTLISSSENIEIVLELNSTLDDPERSIDVMDYKPLEARKQSPNIQWKNVGPKDATEAERHFADAKISAELPKLDEKENIPDKYLESNPFDSSGCKLNVLGDMDANVDKGFVGDVDSERSNLATEAFAEDTISESNESYESQPDKDGDANLIESCIHEAEKVNNNFGEQASSEVSMTAEVSTIMMKADITLEQKGQSPILNMCGSEADNVAEEDIAHDQLYLKNCNELDQSIEDGHINKPRQSHNLVLEYSASDPSKRSMRRMLKNDVLNISGSSKGNTADLEGKKEGSAGLVELSVGEECLPAENTKYDENPTNSEDVAVTTKCRTSIPPHVSVEHDYDESSAAMNLGLEQRKQSPLVQWKGDEAGSSAKVNRNYDQGELKYDGQYHSLNECRTSSIPDTSIRSARRILQDEIDDEDSLGLQKNDAGLEKIFKVQFNKEENFSFIQPCMREQCTSAENYKENPTNFDNAMAAMKTEDANSTMNLDIASGQRDHSPAVDRNGCEADSVAEVERNYGKRELKSDELSNNIEDRPFYEKYHFPRSILKGGENSTECQKSPTASRKTFEDESIGFIDFHVIRKCNSVIDDNSKEAPIYSECPMRAILSASGDFSRIPLIDNNEHTASRSSDIALDQREQTPVQHINDCHVDNVTECHESHAQLEFYCDESAESVDDICMEEHHNLPNKCPVSKVSYSPSSASRILRDEIVGGSEDSMKCVEHYKVAPEEDGTAGPNESFVIGRYTSTNNYEEDNAENTKDAIKEVTRTVKFARIPMVDKNEEDIGTRNLEMSEQSLAMQQNGCQTDNVAENDRNHGHNELSCDESAKSVEGRPSEEHCNFPDKCQMPSLSNISRRILGDKSANAGKDLNESEIKEVSADSNKIEHSISPDASSHKQENIKDAMNDVADALRTSEVKNYTELASFQRGNNNAEGFNVTKLQKEVVAVEAGDTSAEGIPSPISDNDAQEQVLAAGDEIFAENGTKEDSYGISEKISDFASSEQLSETNFNVKNIQEEFSCKDQEDNGEEKGENLTSIFCQVQFAMPEVHGEDKIVNIVDDGSSNLSYKNHQILKESDVADTINEYIESESTMNPSSLRVDDTSDALKISVLTQVPEPEDRVAEETNGIITGRKSALSLERDQEKGAADLDETALRSAKISDSKPTTTQRKNSDIVADKNIVLGQQLTSEMREKDIRAILIHGTPRKLQMTADMKENLPSFKIEKVGSLTTVKPTTKRTALRDVFIQKI